jgi:hypothetical protein
MFEIVQGTGLPPSAAQDSAKQPPAKAGAFAADLAAHASRRATGLAFVPGLAQSRPEYPGAPPAVHGSAAALIDVHFQVGGRMTNVAIGQGLGFL